MCNRCILSETIPGITFDHSGVCNYCRREESAVIKHSIGKESMVNVWVMGREEGIEKIYGEQNQRVVDVAREKLGL